MMGPLYSVLRARFRMLLQYRGAAVGGLITQIFFGLLFTMVFKALYTDAGPQPMPLEQVLTYVWLNQAMFSMQPWGPDGEIRQMMRTGTVAYELVRPCPLYGLWFARAVALRSAPALLRGIPLFLAAYLFFGLGAPANWESAAWFLCSLGAAVILSASITVILNCTLFWTISGEGVTLFLPVVAMVLSGQVVPLPLYPDWLQPFLTLQPFRGLVDVPVRIYTGDIPPAGAGLQIAGQCAWCLAFGVLGSFLIGRGIRRVVVQGG